MKRSILSGPFKTLTDGLLVRAPAKINLSLLVGGQRSDGFHEIRTVMVKVSWYDELLFQRSQKKGIELTCTGRYWAPQGKDNLVYKASEMLLRHAGIEPNIKITLKKNIPAGAGLGSASSDAAAALTGLNRFCQLAVSKAALLEMAAKLGSDVAFFMDGPIALCIGRGEKIEKLEEIFNFLAILILSGITVSTKKAYENYRYDQILYERLNTTINRYIEKNRIDLVARMCANMLESSCFSLHRELAELKAKVEANGIGPVCLTGSGSAMFCIVDAGDEKLVKQYQLKLENSIGCESIVVNNNRW